MEMTPAAWFALSPILAAVAAGVFAMLADAFVSRRAAVAASAIGLTVATGLSLYTYLEIEGTRVTLALIGAGNFASALVVVFALSALSVIGGARSLSRREPGGGVAALIAFAAAGCALLASSLDLTMSLIALEIIAVCSYALVASARNARSAEAAMKYAIQGAVATGLFLLGLAIHVGVLAGSGDYVAGSAAVADQLLPATVAMALLFSAYAFKLGAVPFHSWAPDAFETAPAPASAFMASAPKFAAAYGMFLLLAVAFEPFSGGPLNPGVILAVIAALSVVVGNLAALRQNSYARMLGYSGIAQVGYALIGMAIGQVAFAPSLFLLAVYGLAVLSAFLTAEALSAIRPNWDGSVSGMAGLGRERPLLAVATAVAMFSLTGIPLTAGFWGKLFVFYTAASGGYVWLVVVGLLGSVVSFGYYGRVLRSMYFDEAPAREPDAEPGLVAEPMDLPECDADGPLDPAPRFTLAEFVVAACALGILALGIAPALTADGIQPFLRFFTLG